MDKYTTNIIEALSHNKDIELPTCFSPDLLLKYMDNEAAQNILILADEKESVASLIVYKGLITPPVFVATNDFKTLKNYKDWADLVLVVATHSSDNHKNRQLYKGLYRSLKRHGQLLLLTTLADEAIEHPITLEEYALLDLLQYQKFHGIALLERGKWPHKLLNQVEYREFIITAFKGKEGICYEEGHAVIYKGPFKEVEDDGGHKLIRGKRMAVCEKTYKLLTTGPYKDCIIGLPPYQPKNKMNPLFSIALLMLNGRRNKQKVYYN